MNKSEYIRDYSGGVWIRGYMVGCEGEDGEFWDWVGELCVVWHIVLDDELKLDTVKTAIYDYDQDISDIVNVAKKYFNGGR